MTLASAISDVEDMAKEAREKEILHWNYRGLPAMPEAVWHVGRNVEEIYMKHNRLKSLPCWIADLSRLTNLYLSGNRIDSLPDALCDATQLTSLDLSGNYLTELPRDTGRLVNLRSLVLRDNRIESLPASMSQLRDLEYLHLSGNRMVALPEWLGSLPRLQELHVNDNSLMELPNRLTLSKSLTTLDVRSNNLTYLPLSGFVSSADVQFASNLSLNYLSLPMFYHLESKLRPGPVASARGSTTGSFAYEERTEFTRNARLLLRRGNGSRANQRIVLELPRQLMRVHAEGEKKVVSLWEMSLRRTYSNRFHYKLGVTENPRGVRLECEPRSSGSSRDHLERSKSLLHFQLMANGPISVCFNDLCHGPIFTEAWILVAIERIDFGVPVIVTFCSHRCAAEFRQASNFTDDYEICSFCRIN